MPTIRFALSGPFLTTCFLLSALLVGAPTTVQAITIEKIAVQGDPVPGVPGATFKYFDSVLVNRHGQVAFGTIDSNDTPYYMTNTGGGPLRAVARPGTTAVGNRLWEEQPTRLWNSSIGVPNQPFVVDMDMPNPIPVDTGILVGGNVLRDTCCRDHLFFVDKSGVTVPYPFTELGDPRDFFSEEDPLSFIMNKGTVVTSPSGDQVISSIVSGILSNRFRNIEFASTSGATRIPLDGNLLPTGVGAGLSLNTSGTVTLEIANRFFQDLDYRLTSLSSQLWVRENSVWRQIGGAGLPVPDRNAVQIAAYDISLNSRGEMAYITAWQDGEKIQQGVVKVDQDGTHSMIAQFDDPLPDGAVWAFDNVLAPIMLEDGSVAYFLESDFLATVGVTGRALGLAFQDSEGLDISAVQTTILPGTGMQIFSVGPHEHTPRVTRFSTELERGAARMAANSHNDIVFNAMMSDAENFAGILDMAVLARLGDTGELVPLILPGQELDVNGVLKTVQNASAFTGNSNGVDGRPTSLSNTRQVAVTVLFTDGTEGLFLVTIPEPGMALLVIVASAGLLARRSHRERLA